MNKLTLMTENEYLNGMRNKEIITQKEDVKFCNAFYVEGLYKNLNVCATIGNEKYTEFKKLLKEQNVPQLNSGEQN